MGLFQKQNSHHRITDRVKQAFKYLILFVYLGFGLFLLLKGWHTLSNTQNISIGVLLVLYSIFRAFRLVQENVENEGDDESLDN
jgi:hypothetical protein